MNHLDVCREDSTHLQVTDSLYMNVFAKLKQFYQYAQDYFKLRPLNWLLFALTTFSQRKAATHAENESVNDITVWIWKGISLCNRQQCDDGERFTFFNIIYKYIFLSVMGIFI